jgi:hypothetical protein
MVSQATTKQLLRSDSSFFVHQISKVDLKMKRIARNSSLHWNKHGVFAVQGEPHCTYGSVPIVVKVR